MVIPATQYCPGLGLLKRIFQHSSVKQCYEFWVHSDIPSSFRSLGNEENLSFKSPSPATLGGPLTIVLGTCYFKRDQSKKQNLFWM